MSKCVRGGSVWCAGRGGSDSKGELWVSMNNTTYPDKGNSSLISTIVSINNTARVSSKYYPQTTQRFPKTNKTKVSTETDLKPYHELET